MAICKGNNTCREAETSVFEKHAQTPFVGGFLLWILFAGVAGCEGGGEIGTAAPPDSTDHAAYAKLTINVEVDYHILVGKNEWAIREWDRRVLQGDWEGDCSYRFDDIDDINVEIQDGDAYAWSEDSFRELAEHAGYSGDLAEERYLADTYKSHKDASDLPNLHVLMAKGFPEKHYWNPDGWKYTDLTVPEEVQVWGFSYHPGGEYTCYFAEGAPGPVGVIFPENVTKYAVDFNDWFLDRPVVTEEFNPDSLILRTLSHELFHQCAMFWDDDQNGLLCHDGNVCRCLFSPVIREHVMTLVQSSDFTVNQLIRNLQAVCLGEVGNASHYQEGCSFSELCEVDNGCE